MDSWSWDRYEDLGLSLGLQPSEFWRFTPRELNKLAKIQSEERRAKRKARRWETAILVTYIVNTSRPKVPKDIEDVYHSMRILDEKEEKEREALMGPRRIYKGSMSSRFKQHAEFLEQKRNGHHFETGSSARD